LRVCSAAGPSFKDREKKFSGMKYKNPLQGEEKI
jgi:hypothetical protein